VHGGILMTLLDEVMTWGAILTFRKACVAAEMTVRLKAPVGVGNRIRVEGWIGASKSRVVSAEGRILDQEGVLLATATGKYMAMSQEAMQLCAEDFVFEPQSLRLPFLEMQNRSNS
jgi:acyl-coenzyme A thioesterase PaaI-like protein